MSTTSLNIYLFKLLYNIYSRHVASSTSFLTATSYRIYHHFHMVRSTIIVRASDALPLAASVDDEQVLS